MAEQWDILHIFVLRKYTHLYHLSHSDERSPKKLVQLLWSQCEVTKAEVGTGHEIFPKLLQLRAVLRSLKMGALTSQKCRPLESGESRDSEHPDAWVSHLNPVAW